MSLYSELKLCVCVSTLAPCMMLFLLRKLIAQYDEGGTEGGRKLSDIFFLIKQILVVDRHHCCVDCRAVLKHQLPICLRPQSVVDVAEQCFFIYSFRKCGLMSINVKRRGIKKTFFCFHARAEEMHATRTRAPIHEGPRIFTRILTSSFFPACNGWPWQNRV